MKRIKLTFLILTSLLIVNCSSDDNGNSNQGNLFDEWRLTKVVNDNTSKTLTHCQSGMSVIFTKNFEARFIVLAEEGLEPDIIQEGFEECNYTYGYYDLFVDENNEFLYLIVPGEGTTYKVDDYIAQFKINTLNSTNLTITIISETWKGKIENFEQNKINIELKEQITYFYKRK